MEWKTAEHRRLIILHSYQSAGSIWLCVREVERRAEGTISSRAHPNNNKNLIATLGSRHNSHFVVSRQKYAFDIVICCPPILDKIMSPKKSTTMTGDVMHSKTILKTEYMTGGCWFLLACFLSSSFFLLSRDCLSMLIQFVAIFTNLCSRQLSDLLVLDSRRLIGFAYKIQ